MRLSTDQSSSHAKAAIVDDAQSVDGEKRTDGSSTSAKVATIDGEELLDYYYDQVYKAASEAVGTSRTAGVSPIGRKQRTATSLDIKVEGGSKKTTPPTAKQRNAAASSNVSKRQSAGGSGSRAGSRARSFAKTRSSGSSDGEGRYYDISDLEGMDEEQLLQALYDDPHLAEAAKAAAAAAAREKTEQGSRRRSRQKREDTNGMGGGSTGDRYYRTADGTVKKISAQPAYLETMMEEGIPIKQWIVICFLLGAGFYQLRKTLAGPAVDTSVKKSGVKKMKDKGGRTAGKQKGKKTGAGKSRGVVQKPPHSRPEPQDKGKIGTASTKEQSIKREKDVPSSGRKIESEHQAKSVGADDKKKTPKKKKSKKPVAEKKAEIVVTEDLTRRDEERPSNSPDSVSTDGSSSTAAGPQQEEEKVDNLVGDKLKMLNSYNEDDRRAIMKAINDEDAVDEGEWKTVGIPSKQQHRVTAEPDSELPPTVDPSHSGVESEIESAVQKPSERKSGEVLKTSPPASGGERTANTKSFFSKAGVSSSAQEEKIDTTATAKTSDSTAEERDNEIHEEKKADLQTPDEFRAENGAKESAECSEATGTDASQDRDQKPAQKSKIDDRGPEAERKEEEVTASSSTKAKSAEILDARPDTEDDAALALMLQMQEEKMVDTSNDPGSRGEEEMWEEVTPRKRKKPVPVAEGPKTATSVV